MSPPLLPDTLSGRFQFDTVVHNAWDRGRFPRKRDGFRHGPRCTDSDGVLNTAPQYRDGVPVRVRLTVRDFSEIVSCRFNHDLSHNNSPVRSPGTQNRADRDTIPPAVTIHHRMTPLRIFTISLLSDEFLHVLQCCLQFNQCLIEFSRIIPLILQTDDFLKDSFQNCVEHYCLLSEVRDRDTVSRCPRRQYLTKDIDTAQYQTPGKLKRFCRILKNISSRCPCP